MRYQRQQQNNSRLDHNYQSTQNYIGMGESSRHSEWDQINQLRAENRHASKTPYSRPHRRESYRFSGGQEHFYDPAAYSYNTSPYERMQMDSTSFRGKGPKGYKRSDDRIYEDVCEALAHDQWVDASGIDVSVKDGVVSLSGPVDSRAMKRQAEDCVERVSGVKDVVNSLKCANPPSLRSETTAGTSSNRKM